MLLMEVDGLIKVSIYIITIIIMFPAFLDCYEANHNSFYFHIRLGLHMLQLHTKCWCNNYVVLRLCTSLCVWDM